MSSGPSKPGWAPSERPNRAGSDGRSKPNRETQGRILKQNELWVRALITIDDVQQAIGKDLSHEFRSTQTYQAYTALCGEAYHAFQDDELDDELVDMLAGYADKVVTLHREWQE